MAYFYVKNGLGTRTTGGGITKQTGSFSSIGASNVYASIYTAFQDPAPPVPGDFILVSDLHDTAANGQTGDYTYQNANTDTQTPIYVICVDDPDVEALRTMGSNEENSGDSTYNMVFDEGCWYFYGINLTAEKIEFYDVSLFAQHCSFYPVRNLYDMVIERSWALLHNCDLNLTAGTKQAFRYNQAHIEWYGGTWTLHSSQDAFLEDGVRATLILDGIEFTGGDSETYWLLGQAASIDLIKPGRVYGRRCKLPHANMLTQLMRSNNNCYGTAIYLTHCDVAGATSRVAKQHQISEDHFVGDITENTTVARTTGQPLPDDTTYLSIEMAPNGNVDWARPLMYDLFAGYHTTESSVRVRFASNSTLNKDELTGWAVYPDATDVALGSISVYNQPNLVTPGTAAHTTDGTSSWSGSPTYKYQMDISLGSDAEGPVSVRVFLNAEKTVYLDSEVEFVS